MMEKWESLSLCDKTKTISLSSEHLVTKNMLPECDQKREKTSKNSEQRESNIPSLSELQLNEFHNNLYWKGLNADKECDEK